MEALDPKGIINTLEKVLSQPWNANEKKSQLNLIVTFKERKLLLIVFVSSCPYISRRNFQIKWCNIFFKFLFTKNDCLGMISMLRLSCKGS